MLDKGHVIIYTKHVVIVESTSRVEFPHYDTGRSLGRGGRNPCGSCQPKLGQRRGYPGMSLFEYLCHGQWGGALPAGKRGELRTRLAYQRNFGVRLAEWPA